MTAEETSTSPSPLAQDLPCLAFVHIPKTAGTSITHALQRIYGPQSFSGMTTLDYRAVNDESLHKYRFFKGHAYRCDYQRLPQGTVKFTILRDPVRRALSYVNYYRTLDHAHITDDFVREASLLAKTQSPIELIYSDSPFVIEHIRLGQMRQFLSVDMLRRVAHRQFLSRALRTEAIEDFIREIDQFEFVLTCENLALSYPLMLAQLGLPACAAALPHENASQASKKVDMADIRRAMVDVNPAGFECYDYVRAREQAWLARHLSHPLVKLTPEKTT